MNDAHILLLIEIAEILYFLALNFRDIIKIDRIDKIARISGPMGTLLSLIQFTQFEFQI